MHMELGQYKYLGGNVLSLIGNHKEGKDRKVVTLVKSPDPSFLFMTVKGIMLDLVRSCLCM